MSSSDYLELKRSRIISNKTFQMKLQTLQRSVNIDEYGDSHPSTWYGISIPRNFVDISSSFVPPSSSFPHHPFDVPPLHTITMCDKAQLRDYGLPSFCGSSFPTIPHSKIYTGGDFHAGTYDYIACNQCGGVGEFTS